MEGFSVIATQLAKIASAGRCEESFAVGTVLRGGALRMTLVEPSNAPEADP
jgi:hypothetical protein